MRVKKRQWVAVNFETGETCNIAFPVTLHRAERIFSSCSGLQNGFTIFERWEDIKQ